MNIDIYNAYELSSSDHIFFYPLTYSDSNRHGYSSLPINDFEKKIKRPKISRYRAVLSLALSVYKTVNSLVITHMPTMTAAVVVGLKITGVHRPHIAFAFNYTVLPAGFRHHYHMWAFRAVNKFIVFSEFERHLYSQYFKVPISKFVFIPWTQDLPPVNDHVPMPFDGVDYLCVIGGEGRDYRLLVNAAKETGIPVMIIGRPNSLKNVTLPDNVCFYSNMPIDTVWGYATKSKGMVLPLLDSDTCCGQITIVSALMLGVPIICTKSKGLIDYTDNNESIIEVAAGSLSELISAMQNLYLDGNEIYKIASINASRYRTQYARGQWTAPIENVISELMHK